MKIVILLCTIWISAAMGHMQMSQPYPIRSPLNKNATGPKDYSYTSPLNPSGSDFPCKGYSNDPFVSVAEYTAGQTYEMTLAGGATHGGGSCQISLSYDTAKTFHVIHSMLGGCPLTDQYNFQIPSDAPSGDALLVWTWFNKIGNREMYMNCAQVTIKGGGAKRSHPRDLTSILAPRSTFNSLPPIFLANVNQEGQCTTIEEQDVNFPLPGESVEGSLSGKGYVCKSAAPFLGTGSSGSSNSSTPSGSTGPTSSAGVPASSVAAQNSSSSSTRTSSVTPTVSIPAGPSSSSGASESSSSLAVTPTSSPVPVSTPTAASSPAPAPTESQPPAPPPSGGSSTGGCTSGSIACAADGKSWSMCSNGALVYMGSVAAGMLCQNGQMVAA